MEIEVESDDDVAMAVQKHAERSGKSFSEAATELLAAGLGVRVGQRQMENAHIPSRGKAEKS
jgi:hypothetical protein